MGDPGDTQDGTPEVSEAEVEAAMDAIDDVLQWRESARHTDDPDVLVGDFPESDYREMARAALKAAYAVRRDTQDGTEWLAQLITQGLMEVGDELRREGAKFPTAVALMEEVGRRVAAQVTQDGTEREGR